MEYIDVDKFWTLHYRTCFYFDFRIYLYTFFPMVTKLNTVNYKHLLKSSIIYYRYISSNIKLAQ